MDFLSESLKKYSSIRCLKYDVCSTFTKHLVLKIKYSKCLLKTTFLVQKFKKVKILLQKT